MPIPALDLRPGDLIAISNDTTWTVAEVVSAGSQGVTVMREGLRLVGWEDVGVPF